MILKNTATLRELIRFVEGGMYERLHEAYYQTVWNWLPYGISRKRCRIDHLLLRTVTSF